MPVVYAAYHVHFASRDFRSASQPDDECWKGRPDRLREEVNLDKDAARRDSRGRTNHQSAVRQARRWRLTEELSASKLDEIVLALKAENGDGAIGRQGGRQIIFCVPGSEKWSLCTRSATPPGSTTSTSAAIGTIS